MRYSKIKRSQRLAATARHKRRLRAKSAYCGYPGPWYREDKNRVVIITMSNCRTYIKRQSNKALRQIPIPDEELWDVEPVYPRNYRVKNYDYWWELI